jgi:hypothetical protein
MGESTEAQGLLNQLHAGVEAMVSGEDWRRLLELSSRLHHYSFGNTLLIAMQCPDASMVAGYKRWQDLGRQVRKGERSIRILAPVVVKRETEDNDEPARVVVGFRGAAVFDIGQTDGPDLPTGPMLLEGEAPAGLLARVVELIEAQGYRFERGDCGRTNGFTDPGRKLVQVRADVSDAQAAKTALHELAHVLMHAGASFECRGVREIEAESVAFVVAGKAGLSTDSYSFGYVVGWSGGDSKLVTSTGDAVLRVAERIIQGLHPATA